jgi:hypothetical protein
VSLFAPERGRPQRAAGLGDGLAAGDALADGDPLAAGDGLGGVVGLVAGVGSGVFAGGFGTEQALATINPAATSTSSPVRTTRDPRAAAPETTDDDMKSMPSW